MIQHVTTKVCPRCKVEKKLSEFIFQTIKGVRKPKRCKPCAVEQVMESRRRLAAGGPRRHKGRPKLSTTLPLAGTRTCIECGIEKPVAGFPQTKGRWRRNSCQGCLTLRKNAWEAANPERAKEHSRRAQEKVKAMRATFRTFGYGIPPERLDAMRKSLVQHPPELQTEQESLAYFRGFMAGAKRTQDESERFDRLKDLCHRIAAERKFLRYEDAISVAYEGLLAFLRGRRSLKFDSPTDERRMAAQAIRCAVIDGLRLDGPRNKDGLTRYTEDTISQHADSEGSTSYLDPTSQDRAGDDFDFLHDLGSLDLPPRSQRILELLAAGHTYKEIGAIFDLTESRACQIVKDLAKTHPELEKLLSERVA